MHSEEAFRSRSQSLDQNEQVRCNNTERRIKHALKNAKALSEMTIDVKPHGSYRANTSIRRNSDVDIRVCLKSAFFYYLPPNFPGKPEDIIHRDTSVPYKKFKTLVEDALICEFGEKSVVRGNKALYIHEKLNRVDADVVAVFEYRFYMRQYALNGKPLYHAGITFVSDNGHQIINWPEQTYENGIQKNDETGKRYKAVIRILKRLRTEMQEKKIPQANNTASFLIESLVWNVPNEGFGHANLSDDVRYVLAYCFTNTKSNALCSEWHEVNGLKVLFKRSQPWTRQQAHQFLSAVWNYVGFE